MLQMVACIFFYCLVVMYWCLFILYCLYFLHIIFQLTIDKCLVCLQLLAIISNTAISMGMHISLWIDVLYILGKYPGVEFCWEHMEFLFVVFWGISLILPNGGTNLCFHHCKIGFSLYILSTLVPCLLENCHTHQC